MYVDYCQGIKILTISKHYNPKMGKQLSINHQFMTIQESYRTRTMSSCKVLCESYRQNGEHIGAALCQQCKDICVKTVSSLFMKA